MEKGKVRVNQLIYFLLGLLLLGSSIISNATINILVFVIALAVLLSMSYKQPHIYVSLLILFSCFFMYLMPAKVFGVQIEKLELMIPVSAYLIWGWKGFKGHKSLSWNYKSLNTTLIIVILGALAACFTVRQSFFSGILYQTRLLVILSVGPLVCLMKYENISRSQIEKAIVDLSIVYSLLLIVQYFAITKIRFLKLEVNTSRFGNMRIYVYMFTAYAIFICFSNLLKKCDCYYLIAFGMNVFTLLFIVQSRMTMVGAAFSILIAFMYTSDLSKLSTYKKAFLIVICGIIAVILLQDVLLQYFYLVKDEISNHSGNYAARFWEFDYYLKQVKSALFGRGYISPKTMNALKYVTAYGYYDLTDIGIVGLYVTNGVTGIVWYMLIAISLYHLIKRVKVSGGEMFVPVCFLVFSLCTCFNLLPFYYNAEYLVITFLLLAMEQKNLQS